MDIFLVCFLIEFFAYYIFGNILRKHPSFCAQWSQSISSLFDGLCREEILQEAHGGHQKVDPPLGHGGELLISIPIGQWGGDSFPPVGVSVRVSAGQRSWPSALSLRDNQVGASYKGPCKQTRAEAWSGLQGARPAASCLASYTVASVRRLEPAGSLSPWGLSQQGSVLALPCSTVIVFSVAMVWKPEVASEARCGGDDLL